MMNYLDNTRLKKHHVFLITLVLLTLVGTLTITIVVAILMHLTGTTL